MGSKAKRAAREIPYRAERERVAAMQGAERTDPNVRDYNAMAVIKMTVPGDINTTRGLVTAPVKILKVKPASGAVSTETVARWAAEHAVQIELNNKAEKDRKAAYKKLHTPVAGNPAKRTGGIE